MLKKLLENWKEKNNDVDVDVAQLKCINNK